MTVRLNGAIQYQIDDFTVSGDLVLGTSGEFTVTGDLTSWLFPGDMLWIEGATTGQHDGIKHVMEVNFAGGLTTVGCTTELGVILAAAVEVFDVIEAGVVGTTYMRKIVGLGPGNLALVTDDFTVAGPDGEFEVAGDYSALDLRKAKLLFRNTTTNDLILTIVSATFGALDTTFVVEEAVTVEPMLAATTFQLIEDEAVFQLTANIPQMWTIGGGMANPSPEDVLRFLATNDSGVAAAFQARVVANSP